MQYTLSKIQKNLTKQSGFTIVELLVVIVVIGILAVLTMVSYSNVSSQAIVASLKSDLTSSARLLSVYYTDNGTYPASVNDCPSPQPTNICLKLSGDNQLDSPNAYTRITANSYILRIKNGSKIWMVTENTQPSEVAPITAIAATVGVAQRGTNLTAGTLTPSGATVTYQWQFATSSGGTYTDISGATTNTYTLTASDVGNYIRVKVTGSGSYYDTKYSAATGPVVVPPPIFATGGSISDSGGYRTHTFNSGSTSITAGNNGTVEVTIKGAGGGGGAGDNYNSNGMGYPGGSGGSSSLVHNSLTYIGAGGGGGGAGDCEGSLAGNGANGGYTANGLTGTIGGGSNGGARGNGDGSCGSYNYGGNGGKGGLVAGSINIISGQTITITVGAGGTGGSGGDPGTPGDTGAVTLRYLYTP